ncbi:MAG: SAM-dependent methyltransferase [Bryobacterales bacterium]|nr:SAM-dependent methyltransferase [Bryobacterales bacterium]
MQTVKINRKAAARVTSGHPWIFKSDVLDAGEAQPGDAVRVTEANGRFVGTAHYSAASQITLRMLSTKQVEVDRTFFRERFLEALRHRQRLLLGSTAYRLAHAEGDFLPGLIVDRYGDYFTIQTLDQGMDRAAPEIVAALVEIFSPAGIIARNDAPVRALEALPRETRILHGEIPAEIELEVNGLRLHANLAHGQKTGIFLDQRENYLAAARYARGKALDCFTSSGGFALHMAAACEHVEAIDSSEPAIEMARRNAEANGIGNIEFREADVFEVLSTTKRRYNTIVLDPPAFTKSRSQVDAAMRGYKDINLRALKLLEPEGILVTCSCSHHVSEADLLDVIAQASLDAGKTLRVLERRTQGQDHPILLTVPETHYLKCIILQSVGAG